MEVKFNNKYYILRHGEAKSNVKSIVSSWPEKFNNPLTKKGVSEIKKAAGKLKGKNINFIFASPLLRTRETAEIVGKVIGVKPKIDKRLREIDFGTFNYKPVEEFGKYFKINNIKARIKEKTPGGENYMEVTKRMFSFLKQVDKKFKNKNILIVSHQAPLLLLRAKVMGISLSDSINKIEKIFEEKRMTKGELVELN